LASRRPRGFLAGFASDDDAWWMLCRRASTRDDILAAGPRLGRDGFARPLRVDEVDQCRFVLILELVRFEPSGLLLHDVPTASKK
jgi:hypothetical protein